MSGNSSRWSVLIFSRHSFAIGALATMLVSSAASFAATITPGNLVLSRAAGGPNGDATVALQGGGTAAAVFLDEYTTAGVFVQSFAMPTTLNATVGSQRALTLSGTANTEGLLTLSGNGQYFIIGGYNQTATAAGTNGSASTAVERVVGRMDFNGSIDTSTALVDAMSGQNIRSAYSTDGTTFYVTGNGGGNVTVNAVPNIPTTGVHQAQFGVNTGGTTLSTQINTGGNLSNNRQVLSFGNNLYVSNGNTSNPNSLARGVDIMGPTGTGPQLFSLPGFPTAAGPAPDDYWFFDDNTIYLADTRTDGVNGGIQKWTFNGTTWALQYTLGSGAGVLTTIGGGNAGVHGLTGMINGSGLAVLFGTTFDGTGANQTKFFTITDNGSTGTSPVTYLGTSPANTAFRGIEIALSAPVSTAPEPGSIALLLIGLLAALTNIRHRK